MNFSQDTRFLLGLSQVAADMAVTSFDSAGSDFTIKADLSPVTETDIAINKKIIEIVQKEKPAWAVMGEEEQWNTESEIKLFVDPIDGTKPFIWGQATFGCMFSLVVDGKVISAVVVNPVLRRTVVAEQGQGSWIYETKTQIFVSDKGSFQGQVVFLHSKSAQCAGTLVSQKGSFVAGNSAAEVAVMTAKGSWVGAILNLPSPHDIAASKIIVEEAGGKVTDLHGNDQRYDGLLNGAIISNGLLHDQLVEMYKNNCEK